MTGRDVPQPLDLWLARQLRAQNDAVLRERVPEGLLALICPPPGQGARAEVAGQEE